MIMMLMMMCIYSLFFSGRTNKVLDVTDAAQRQVSGNIIYDKKV